MDRNETTENQNSTIGQVVVEMSKGFSANKTTHAKRRSVRNHLRTSFFHLKKHSIWYNHKLNEGKRKFKEIGKRFLENHFIM